MPEPDEPPPEPEPPPLRIRIGVGLPAVPPADRRELSFARTYSSMKSEFGDEPVLIARLSRREVRGFRFGPDLLVPEPIEADNLGSGVFRVLNIATVGLIGPFAEEVFFRGFLVTAFVPTLGVVRAAALASAVFAISHIDLGVMVPFFFTGLLLAWLYIKTRSIWPPLLAHVAQNVLAIIGMFATA